MIFGLQLTRRTPATSSMSALSVLLLVLFVCTLALAPLCLSVEASPAGGNSTNRNNWAVIVSASRFFFNYRHATNAFSIYHTCRQHGIDDDHIILFVAESFACDPRNNEPATMASRTKSKAGMANLYGCSTRVDFAGDDVDVRRFLEVMQGRFDSSTPPSRRLDTDENSNILVYLNGHGAEGAFKFQDTEFLDAAEIAQTFDIMFQQRRYNKIVFMPDTCHAVSLCRSVTAPNVLCIASSSATEDSYSHHADSTLGLAVIGTWTYQSLMLMEDAKCSSRFSEEEKRSGLKTSLQESWHDFQYGYRRHSVPGPGSKPDHRSAANDPQSMHTWTVEEFLCGEDYKKTDVPINDDIL